MDETSSDGSVISKSQLQDGSVQDEREVTPVHSEKSAQIDRDETENDEPVTPNDSVKSIRASEVPS